MLLEDGRRECKKHRRAWWTLLTMPLLDNIDQALPWLPEFSDLNIINTIL